jgi:hypothetical protein
MPKVLVCGEIAGAAALDALHAKVGKLTKSAHGPFDVLFCTGIDAAALSRLESFTEAFPVPLHFLALPGAGSAAIAFGAGAASAERLHATWLGTAGVTDVAGLRVAFTDNADEAEPGFVKFLAKLRGPSGSASSGASGGVDVLLSHDWPKGVLSGLSPASLSPAVQQLFYSGNTAAARAAQHCEARYHFAGSRGVFFQRPPYFSSGTAASSRGLVTRFIGLSGVQGEPGADEKGEKKSLHALNLVPMRTLDASAAPDTPPGTTMSPFGSSSSLLSAPPAMTSRPDDGDDGSAGPAAKRARLDPSLTSSYSGSSAASGSGAANGGGLSAERIAALEAESASTAARGFFYNTNARGRGGRGGGRMGQQRDGMGGGDRHPRHDGQSHNHPGGQYPRPFHPKPGSDAPPPDCWFCLASPKVEKHLVVSIGEETYLGECVLHIICICLLSLYLTTCVLFVLVFPIAALPKGGVSDTHLLIVPVSHHDSLASAPRPVQAEVRRFLTALSAYYASRGLWLLAFERVLHRAGRNDVPLHTHMQVIGLPKDAAKRAEATFISEGQYKMLQFEKLGDASLVSAVMQAPTPAQADAPAASASATGELLPASPTAQSTCEYLYVQAPDAAAVDAADEKIKDVPDDEVLAVATAAVADAVPVRLLHKVPPGTKHPVQFGREVLCRLLSCPERIQWKSCALSSEEEAAATTAFRESFAPFDFTLALGAE